MLSPGVGHHPSLLVGGLDSLDGLRCLVGRLCWLVGGLCWLVGGLPEGGLHLLHGLPGSGLVVGLLSPGLLPGRLGCWLNCCHGMEVSKPRLLRELLLLPLLLPLLLLLPGLLLPHSDHLPRWLREGVEGSLQ